MLLLIPLLLAATRATPDPAQALAGRYYAHFPSGFWSGEKYAAEQIVEIVPVAPGAAYVRIHLDTYNGHGCTFAGVANAEDGKLVYRSAAPAKTDAFGRCILSISRSGRSLRIDDLDRHGCSIDSCGAYGSLEDIRLPYASRRPIRYMARLKTSLEYRDALIEWRTGKPAPR
jgi:hypothetical protein